VNENGDFQCFLSLYIRTYGLEEVYGSELKWFSECIELICKRACAHVLCFLDAGMQLSSSTVTYTMLPDCECGCLLDQSSGYLVVSSATYCPSKRIWLIRVSGGLLIRLTVIRFKARHGTVRVHDGNSSLANLLLQIDAGSTVPLSPPQPLISAGNTIRVEYVLPPDDPLTTDVINDEFVALYRAVSKYITRPLICSLIICK